MARKPTPAATPAKPLALHVTAAPCANVAQAAAAAGLNAAKQVRKYASAAAANGLGNMPNGAKLFTLGAWPRNRAHPNAPAASTTFGSYTPNGYTGIAGLTVPQAFWLAARVAGATATNAVTGHAIAVAALAPNTLPHAALMCTKAARQAVRGAQYAQGGNAIGHWFSGYLTPKGGAVLPKGGLAPKG